MAQLVSLIVSDDDVFRKQIGRLLRAGTVPVSIVEDGSVREGVPPEVIIVDARGDAPSAMTKIERLRANAASASIFAIALTADPDLILQAMRAGANEFFIWPPADETFHGAIRRTSTRREATQGSRPSSTTFAFFGAKGGAGTTTVAVNCAVELARLSKRGTVIVDLKAGLGEVALFLGIRPRYSVLDAIDNLHRLDRDFLRELVMKHKSGLEILAGSDHFDRPGASDGTAIEELMRLLTRQYDYLVVDVGSQINSCTVAALYCADQIFLVANPDVPSVRNAQRVIERVRELGACGERVRLLMNRSTGPCPVPLKQIEKALGYQIHHVFPSDFKTVSTALNAGVPLALTGDSEIATQFDQFTRRLLDPSSSGSESVPASKSVLSLDRIASIW